MNVWGTWCEPCKTELPVLDAYARQPGAAKVLTVQVGTSESEGLALLTQLGVHLPVVHGGDEKSGPVVKALKVTALPSSYLITADGRVRLISNPRTFGNADQVRAAVQEDQ